jgi:hypothetical protein
MSTSLFPVHAGGGGGGGTLGVLLMINGLRIHYCLKESFLLLAPTTLLPGIWIHKTPTHPKKTLLKQKEKTDNPDQDNEQQSLHWVYMGLWKERKREREREKMGWICTKE